jgi:kumamolisin
MTEAPKNKQGAERIPPNYRRVDGSERRPARGARLVGLADPKETLSISICLRRRPDAPPVPDQTLWAKTPPGRRKYLSRRECAAKYGAAQADLDRVTEFARSHGLSIVQTSVGGRTVVVSGTVEQINKAFFVELGRYESSTQKYRGREGFVYLPSGLAEIVTAVLGLDNRRVIERDAIRRHVSPAGAVPTTPTQVARLYNFPFSNAIGQTIAILEFAGGFVVDPNTNRPTDIDEFCKRVGVPSPMEVLPVGVDGGTNSLAGGPNDLWDNDPTKPLQRDPDVEVALDLEIVSSIAMGAKVVVYFAPDGSQMSLHDAVMMAVHDDLNAPSVISTSWGGAEESWSYGGIEVIKAVFQDAAMMGVTVLAPTGDQGSNCGANDIRAHVEYPASDPGVLACGGTYIGNNMQGTWNDETGATGGGISEHFTSPSDWSWQQGANLPPSANMGALPGRGIPDVAGNASSESGYDLVLYGKQLSSSIITSGNDVGSIFGFVGGTSAVAPLYAGLIAVLNANLPQPVGYLNPTLYNIALTPQQNVFQDINDNQNNHWSKGPANTPSYISAPGWDACTGVGRHQREQAPGGSNTNGRGGANDRSERSFSVWNSSRRHQLAERL